MEEYYNWLKSFHLIFVISWMAGLLYLPRIFVYHAEVITGSNEDKTFQNMEKRLLKYIMNPAMILTLIFGLWIAWIYGFKNLGIWFHIKSTLVICLIGFHHYLAKMVKVFAQGKNNHSAKFYRIINEIPTVMMIAIVILVIVKPF